MEEGSGDREDENWFIPSLDSNSTSSEPRTDSWGIIDGALVIGCLPGIELLSVEDVLESSSDVLESPRPIWGGSKLTPFWFLEDPESKTKSNRRNSDIIIKSIAIHLHLGMLEYIYLSQNT